MSGLEREAARQRRAFASLAGMASPGPDCPEPRRLWEAATGRLSDEETRTLVDHLAGCPSCAEDWRLAAELARQAGEEAGGAPAGRFRPRVRWALVAAALLVAVVGLPVLLDRGAVDSPDAVRSVAGEAVVRSLVPGEMALSRTDCVLSWSVAGGPVEAYELTVATEELDVLLKVGGLEEPTFVVPEESLARVPPDGRILWRVEAKLATGRTSASPTFINRLE